jgi:hypothetical protein
MSQELATIGLRDECRKWAVMFGGMFVPTRRYLMYSEFIPKVWGYLGEAFNPPCRSEPH